jgi:hypothetical protein
MFPIRAGDVAGRGMIRPTRGTTGDMRNLIGIIIVVWLVIGVAAAAQRGYFGSSQDVSCKSFGDTALTIVAGPLNYVGANPKITCHTPQPSK